MAIHLNWKELELLIQQIAPKIEGLFVERVTVPARERFPGGYLKGEWVFRLTGKKQDSFLLISIRPRYPYLAWAEGKGPKASTQATRSPFDLGLSKYLKGARLLKCETLPQERIIILWFTEEGKPNHQLGLVLVFIPAAPEAFLVSVKASDRSNPWPILARSRTVRDESKIQTHYSPPQGFQAPPNPTIRTEWISSPESFFNLLEKESETEAFELRRQSAEKNLRNLVKQIRDRLRQSETSLHAAQKEENWQKLGDLLKGSLGTPENSVRIKDQIIRKVMDYETGEEITIPCDPRLTLKDQIEKFFQNSRRKQRRIQEATARIERFNESLARYESILNQKLPPGDWKALEKLERLAQSNPQDRPSHPTAKGKGSGAAWLGKTFSSKDDSIIWVGRSKDENLELTFKHTRGNDIWMHVRGRPGAHVVVPLSSGKSASLETLLDAATLAVYYSGGQNWGKTEVDYTFKKYVKRIKDSTEASYTHNKTLLVELDQQRLQRLLSQN